MAYVFLTQADLQAHIIDQFLTERNAAPQNAILEVLELQNIEIIKTKLKGRFDVTAIFAATGAARHYLIIKILVKLVLYDFIHRNAARKVPADYVKDWEWAMKLLEQIKAGKEVPDGLPPFLDINNIKVSGVKYGNNKNADFYI
ncbi:MAG: hypothetical protein QM486_08570 [Flavobacteriaceae bacterium]